MLPLLQGKQQGKQKQGKLNLRELLEPEYADSVEQSPSQAGPALLVGATQRDHIEITNGYSMKFVEFFCAGVWV